MTFNKFLTSSWFVPALFGAIALLFGGLFIYLTPPMWGVDETEHAARVYQISTGNFVEDKIEGGYGGEVPAPLVELYHYAKQDLLDGGASPVKSVTDRGVYEILDSQRTDQAVKILNFAGAGVYSPVAYAPAVVGAAIANQINPTIGSFLLGARLASLISYIAIVFAALYLVRSSRIKWLIFSIALLPMSVAQAAVVTVDSLSIGAALLLFAYLYRLMQQKDKIQLKQLTIFTLIASVLTLTKPNYILLALPLLAVAPKIAVKRGKFIVAVVALFIAALPALGWNVIAQDIISAVGGIQRPTLNLSMHEQLIYVMSHPFEYMLVIARSYVEADWLYSSVGVLNFNFVRLPSTVFAIALVTILLATLSDNHTGLKRRYSIALVGSSMLASLAVVTALYLSFNEIGSKAIQGVQGRYFLPIVPFFLLGLMRLIPISLKLSDRTLGTLITVLCVANLVISVVLYGIYTYLY